jgi:PAS domain S-box-containing protein
MLPFLKSIILNYLYKDWLKYNWNVCFMNQKPTYEELEQKVKELEKAKSELKKTSTKLQDSEERFKALHDATFGGVIIHDGGVILDCNQGLSDMTGFTNEELVGMDGLKLIEPGWLETVVQNIKKGYAKQYDVEGVRKDGSVYPLAIRGKNIPYKGREVRVIEFRDVSERKVAEDAYLRSEARYKELFENSPIGHSLCNIEGRLVSVNSAYANIIGYSIEEALKLTYWDITPEDYIDAEMELLEKLKIKKVYGPFEKDYIHKDGSLVSVRLNGMIVVRGRKEYIWSSVEDISELKKAEEEAGKLSEKLRQAYKMEAVGTLAGGIAHDFNNILAAIFGYSELALTDIEDGSPVKENIIQILKAAKRAKELVKHILSFSRKEAKKRTPVQVCLIVNEVLKLLRATIPATIDIKQNIDQESGSILADPTQIHQVIMNLCTNAAQSMDEKGGLLEVSVGSVILKEDDLDNEPKHEPGNYVHINVKDTGSGIEKDNLSRIYDPYFTTKEVGKGMGLSVVMGIVRSHDGLLRVESVVGKGTSFHIYFAQTGEKIEKSSDKESKIPGGDERILIVDDEESIAVMTKRRVEHRGYKAVTKTSSVEALELFCSDPYSFDLVISDQTMPVLTGGELAKKILKVRPDIPIIICTGYSSKIDAEKAASIGVNALIMKPTTEKELFTTIREVLDHNKSATL